MRKTNATQEEREEIVKLYLSGKKISEFTNDFGFVDDGHQGVLRVLRKAGVKIRPDNQTHRRRYSVNDNYFSSIDTERKAYWLGLLYADGYNGLRNHGIILQLTESEKYIIEELKKDTESTHPVKLVKARLDKHPNAKDNYKLNIFSRPMQADLTRLGCMKAKSLILKFPTEDQVPKHLQRHFIRGYFDGDGCITNFLNHGKNPRNSVSIISTYDFLFELRKILHEEYGITQTKLKEDKRHSQPITRCLAISRDGDIAKLKEIMYADASIYFTRKYAKFK